VERVCLDCGAKLLGRSDKKFCSDQCRNNYNNRLNRDQNNYVRNVHAQLRRNRRILSDLLDDGHHRIHRDALIAQGYNFTFFTHLVETKDGLRWSYCFEYGFREAGKGYLELQKSSSYLEVGPEVEEM
jgi:predicted nucleic acid-binding Zn ribbon protein